MQTTDPLAATRTSGQGTPGPPAEVYIDIHPPAGRNGRYSVSVYPRRFGDIVAYYTGPGLMATHSGAREILWIARGLSTGLALTISEKTNSSGKGHFGRIPQINSVNPFQLSGPVLKGPPQGGHAVWSYQISLSDSSGELAYVDPDIIIVPDP